MRPFLAHARRGEIHRDAPLGILESGVPHRRPDAILGLAHRAVGQPDGRRVRQARGDVDLDVDDDRVDAAEGAGADAREHDLARANPE